MAKKGLEFISSLVEPKDYGLNYFELGVGLIVILRLMSSGNLAILPVENYENLFDYSYVFSRLEERSPIEMRISSARTEKISVVNVDRLDKDLSGVIQAVSGPGAGGFQEALEFEIQPVEGTPVVIVPIIDLYDPGAAAVFRQLQQLATLMLYRRNGYMLLITSNLLSVYDSFPLAKYAVVLEDVAPRLLEELNESTRQGKPSILLHVVGFRKAYSLPAKKLKEYVRTRRLPVPASLEPLERDVSFRELVLTESIKEFLEINVVSPMKRQLGLLSSIMLIGIPGVGKTTIAYAIARELGLNAYTFRVELIGSKWVGETEKQANQALLIANDLSPVLLYIKDIENILSSKTESESQAYQRVKSIIASWLRSPRRRFFAVISVSNPKQIDESVLQDPSFGEYKIPVLPPLRADLRKRLLLFFIGRMSRRYRVSFNPEKKEIDEALDVVAESTWAYTVRELYDIAKTVIAIALHKGGGVVTKEGIQLARKFKEVDRVYRVRQLDKLIEVAMKVGLPEELMLEIYKFRHEVERLKAEAFSESRKKKGMAIVTR